MTFDQIGGLSSAAPPLQTGLRGHVTSAPAPAHSNASAEVVAQTPAIPATQPSAEQLHDALKKIKEAMPPSAQNLQFSMDDETGQTVIKIIDEQTQTVLRQIPRQELIDIAHALNKLQGLLLKNKA